MKSDWTTVVSLEGRPQFLLLRACLLGWNRLAARLTRGWNKTKPGFRKAVAGWLENLVTTGHLRGWSGKDVVTVLQMGWWQSFPCSSCWVR